MARTLSTEHLPPGATGYVHGGVIYVVGEGGKPTDVNGNAVELPDDFPSDVDLAANAKRAQGPGSKMAALTKDASGREAEDFESMTKDELQSLAEERGLDVTRKGGGDPLKADLVSALEKHAKGK